MWEKVAQSEPPLLRSPVLRAAIRPYCPASARASHLGRPRKRATVKHGGAGPGLGSGSGSTPVVRELRKPHPHAWTRPRTRYDHKQRDAGTASGNGRRSSITAPGSPTPGRPGSLRLGGNPARTRSPPEAHCPSRARKPARAPGPARGRAAGGHGARGEDRSGSRPAPVSPPGPGGARPAPTRPRGPASHQDGLVLLGDPALLLAAEQVAHGGPARTPAPPPAEPTPRGHRSPAPPTAARPRPLRRPPGARRRRARVATARGGAPPGGVAGRGRAAPGARFAAFPESRACVVFKTERSRSRSGGTLAL